MSVVACEYVRLFYHVFKGNGGSANRKYIKKYKRRWIVLKMEFSPVECRLEHYDKEASWQNKKEGQVEHLGEMSLARVIADNDKDHVSELMFPNRSLFLSFDSKTKLDTWMQKLSPLLDRYAVQLMRCPEQPSRIGLYILDLQPSKIDVYDVQTGSLVWSWEMGHLRRFNFHATVPDVEVEAGTRSSTGEGHFYFTGIHMRRLFNGLKDRIGRPASSKPIPIPTQGSNGCPPPLPPRRERSRTTLKKQDQSPSDSIGGPSSLRDCDTLLVHTPSLSSFTQSPRMPSLGLNRASFTSTATANSSLSLSHTEPLELELASSTTTMNLSSLSNALPITLDHTPSEQEIPASQFVEDDSDNESDTSDESIYVQMSVAKGASLMSGSASQNDDNDFDVLDNWTHSEQFECPLHDNPSYISFETVMNK